MEKTINVDGLDILCGTEGAGDPVLLLHGMGFYHSMWKHNVGPLSQYYTVYAPDMPGFGGSGKPRTSYGSDYYIKFLDDFLDALGIESAAIVGNSYFGFVAARFAAAHPDRTRRLALVDAAGFTYSKALPEAMRVGMYRMMLRDRDFDIRAFFADPGKAARLLEGIDLMPDIPGADTAFISNIQELVGPFPGFEASLRAIKAPTLVVWGRKDTTPASNAEQYGKAIRGSRVVVIEDAGHVPNIEKHEEFNKALLGFLALEEE